MSVVDAVAVDGPSGVNEFTAPKRSRRHAWAAFVYVTVLGYVSFRGVQVLRDAEDSFGLVMPVFCWLVAVVGLGVRMGRLRVDRGGVRWGFDAFGFRMAPERVGEVRVYDGAVAVYPKRGRAPWTLIERDWDRWSEVVRAFERSGLKVERVEGKAPWLARMQGYGRALDGILLLNSIGATLVVFGR